MYGPFGLLALQKDVNLKVKGQSESQQAFIGDKKKEIAMVEALKPK